MLAELLVMDRTTLSRNLKPLLACGLTKLESEDDRLVRRAALTEAGRTAYARALPHWRCTQSGLVAALGESRWARTREGLGLPCHDNYDITTGLPVGLSACLWPARNPIRWPNAALLSRVWPCHMI